MKKSTLKVLFVAIVAFVFVSMITVTYLQRANNEITMVQSGVGDDPEPEIVYPIHA